MVMQPNDNNGLSLLIGRDYDTGQPLYYAGEGGLATIGPPGCGKTKCQMMPNLLHWRGPAVVLDVTGELWEKTSARRSEFGPVYKLDITNPEHSDHYNPFDFIRSTASHAWGDAVTFGLLLYSQPRERSSGSGGFFDIATPQYLAALAYFIVTHEPAHRRNCETLIQYSSSELLDGFLDYAKTSDVMGLRSMAATLGVADKDTKGNVIWTAQNCLGPWMDAATAGLTRVSDWHPAMIREHNATLYIRISLEDIQRHPGLVRLVIGQHFYEMMRERVDLNRATWVQFFLDEAPQLRRLDVLLQAIEGGRNFAVRVWMAMQWRAQLAASYGDDMAAGMIGACWVQSYMNPTLNDGTAQKLSEFIGNHRHPLNGRDRPRVSAQALAGDDYKGDVIVFDRGHHSRLRKFWIDDPHWQAMMGANP